MNYLNPVLKKAVLFLIVMLFGSTVVLADTKEHYFSVARTVSGDAIPDAQVTVFLAGTVTLSIIYSDGIGTLKANPFLTDAQGNYDFFVTSGKYKIIVTKIGVGSFTVDNISVGVQLHSESHSLGSTDPISATNLTGVLPDPQLVELAVGGVSIGEGTLIDFINSTNITASDGGTGAKITLSIASESLTSGEIAPDSIGVSELSPGAITNVEINNSAAIAESKLSLNFPTHSNVNDPTVGQKEALVGTFGSPGAGNKYVTNSDPRFHNSTHQNGGTDEISVSGLSGLLADSQKITVENEGVNIGSRQIVNFKVGTGLTPTIIDTGTKIEIQYDLSVLFKIVPSVHPPVVCSAPNDGVIYNDSDIHRLCFCNGTEYVLFGFFSTDDSITSADCV